MTLTTVDPESVAAGWTPPRRAVTDLPLFGTVDTPAPTRAVARHSDPATSHAAAASVGDADTLTEKQRAVLRLMPTDRAVTDPQILLAHHAARRTVPREAPKQSESGLRTRRAELVAFGLVEAAGAVRGETGRTFTTWRLTAKGLAARGEG